MTTTQRRPEAASPDTTDVIAGSPGAITAGRHVAPGLEEQTGLLSGAEAERMRRRAADAAAPEHRRVLGHRTLDDQLALGGSLIGSFALVWIVYARLLPFSGVLGFLVCWFAAFLVLYGVVSAQRHPGVEVGDRLAAAVIAGGAAIVGGALVSVIVYTFWQGRSALRYLPTFITQDASRVGPLTELSQGGILHAVVGTLIEISIAIAITLPLGVGCAVFLTEVGGRSARLVRTVVEAMTALPSVVAGLFVYTTLIIALGFPRSGFPAAIAMSVMMLPIIARAAEVVLRVVPGGLREASLALGASQWQTVRRVVLPTARPGLATALILGVARGIGETAPVLLTSGASTFFNTNPFDLTMNSLPLLVFSYARSGEPLLIARGFGAASVLLALVLVLFVVARGLARQRTGR